MGPVFSFEAKSFVFEKPPRAREGSIKNNLRNNMCNLPKNVILKIFFKGEHRPDQSLG